MLCSFVVLNIVTIGVTLLAKGNASNISYDLGTAINSQNQNYIMNDVSMQAASRTDIGGVLLITPSELQLAGGIVVGSLFIYFIIATNIHDYNLFPSQAKLNQSTRQEIYDLIAQNEGIHLREICRTLNREMGCIQYHIYVLESANLISSMKDGRYKRFFINHHENPEERVIIALLQRETTNKILNLIYETKGNGISHTTIAKELGTSSQAVSWHIHKLEDAGIIITHKSGNQKVYQIAPNFFEIIDSLLKGN